MSRATDEPGVPDERGAVVRPPQWRLAAAGVAVIAVFAAAAQAASPGKALLVLVGAAMGITLYHAAFGFAASYRRLIAERDLSGVAAQLLMLGVATILFAPTLAAGTALGHGVAGAIAPVSVSMAFGAVLFGVGMQVAGGCASGTLFAVGGGSPRMLVVLVFFCVGGFLATFHLYWWSALPSAGSISLGELIGTWQAVAAQIVALALLAGALLAVGCRARTPLWPARGTSSWRNALHGPWPLPIAAVLLALLNWATLVLAGHPWSITWAFTLWAAKLAVLVGWDPSTAPFWSGGFAGRALAGPLLADTTTVMNVGIVAGALVAAALAGRFRAGERLAARSVLVAVAGGLMLGYGARLAYGCNIGALFSGIASTSLHGWVWLVAASVGSAIGLRLRTAVSSRVATGA